MRTYEGALKSLQAIQSGVVTLGVQETGAPQTAGATTMAAVRGARLFGERTLDGYRNT
uniref:Uncharacterized protein n=1 Tax=Candidatus Kentrum eta TaxID=2126337 RepID=A0A450VFM4_9GAMM|nr:MAG: Protein of unknown function (DUF1320) [Candidatus Kentron sp. H]VFK04440.1 MAG: Protein of unknown function (DUF1320) [Candidatus Kentron sp. H]VFK06830.1 MAG: Protein of unknown function (DUF1320) [Candidatus Kentron sp. H]